MSINLLDSLKEYVTPELISHTSSALGESEAGITKAISASLPTLLGGLLNKSNDSNIMSNVIDLATKSNSVSDGGILSNLSGILNGGDSTATELGTNLLSLLFGNKQSGITDMIANLAGIKSSSAGSLLGMAAPLLLVFLGKSGTSSTGLTNLLNSQKESILGALPSGISSFAGFSDNLNLGNSSSSNTSNSTNDSGGGLPKWLVPLMLIGAVLAGLYFFTKGCKKESHEMGNPTEMVESENSNMTDSLSSNNDSINANNENATEGSISNLGIFFKFKLPNGVELNAPENGIENQLVTWLNDKMKVVDKTTWFNFDRLLFETGKSILKPESQEQLKNITEIMKAYPSVEIKLGGYTDNVGDPKANLKLSGERANTVLNELVKLGVAASRMKAEGYGDQHPVASNDTEEGRAQNRRIAIRVIKK